MVLVPEEDGGSRAYRGVMVAGCPMGEAGFVDAWLRAQVSSIESYIEKTVLSLRAASPHALWAAIYYSCSAKFDFILRHLPPDQTALSGGGGGRAGARGCGGVRRCGLRRAARRRARGAAPAAALRD